MAKLNITLIKSKIGKKKNQIATVEALGFKKIGQTVVKEDTSQIRGMIKTISHMVKVEEV